MLKETIGFLGAGKMAEALARGMLEGKLVAREQIVMSDVDDDRRAYVGNALRVRMTDDNLAMVRASGVAIVALKPGVVREVLPGLAEAIGEDRLVVSIAAGISLAELESMLAPGTRVVRVMPNLACTVGRGASAFSLGSAAREADGDLVSQILVTVGISFLLPEKLLNVVTGLSGSGPAYAAVVIEALADGGVLGGLPRDVAVKLAAQTVLGAALLINEAEQGGKRGMHPAQLKDMVASPGGTTIEGLRVLEQYRLRAALIDAVEAATRKAEELGRRSGPK